MSSHSGTTAGEARVIVAFGASNTFGVREGVEPDQTWSARLERRLRSRFPEASVINAGVRGNNTFHALDRIERDVINLRPDYCIVMFALNDSAIDDPDAGPRVAAEAFSGNLRQMVNLMRRSNIVPVMTTATPLSTSAARSAREPYRTHGVNYMVESYVQRARDVARSMDVAMVDTYQAFLSAADASAQGIDRLLLADGMHMNPAGHDVVAQAINDFFMNAMASHRAART